jgi:parvulin-like peptidyl-prolyl isomerase
MTGRRARWTVAALLLGWSAASPLSRLGAPAPLAAQETRDTTTEVYDGIAAVVGNTAIPISRVKEELLTLKQQRDAEGIPMPRDSAGLRALSHQVLDTLIAVELMYQQALKDTTVKVTDQDVSDAVEANVRNLRKRFASGDSLLAGLHDAGFKSLDDYRNWLADQQRRQLYINRFRQNLIDNKTIKSVNPTEKEMKAFYQANLARFQDVPATISLRQIVVAPQADSAARARTIRLADSIIAALRGGARFGDAARRFSMDAATAADSGDLGWFAHGKYVPPIDRAAFTLPVGQISDPIESSYGIHILQVLRREPTEVHARHILLIPEVTPAGAARARALADSILALLARGASFDSLQKLYNDPAEEKEIDEVPVTTLPDVYSQALAGLDSGQTSAVFELPAPGDSLRDKYAIARVVSRAPAGQPSFESVKPLIRDALSQELGQKAYIDGLKAKAYIDIRLP